MKILRVRHHHASISVSFRLSRFIHDWPSAQQNFIGGIANCFHGWHPISSENFVLPPAVALQDLRCKCHLFAGACDLVLSPEAFRLDFKNVTGPDENIVRETIRKVGQWFLDEFQHYGIAGSSFHTLAHMEALEADSVEAYLRQFATPEVDELINTEPSVKYSASNRTVLACEQEGWWMGRVIESSRQVENGIFVDTQIEVGIQSNVLNRIDFQLNLIARVRDLANRVIGLNCEEYQCP